MSIKQSLTKFYEKVGSITKWKHVATYFIRWCGLIALSLILPSAGLSIAGAVIPF
jgi:hypothetical protein